MSRNLCMTSCDRCGADEVKLDEEPRPIAPDEAGVYFPEFEGMLVANAVCPDCDARYLAWCGDVPSARYPRTPDWEMAYYDLSYRSTFNDEPGDVDVPIPGVLEQLDLAVDEMPEWEYDVASVVFKRALSEARDLLAKRLGVKS